MAFPWSHLSIAHDDVSAERLEGDVIAVNLATGAYFSMTGTAADIWTAATSGCHPDHWLATLDAAYGIECPRDEIEQFLSTCLDRRLLVEAPQGHVDALTLPDDVDRTRWLAPELEIFEDFQDLLLVDPIHETSLLGWPDAERRHD